MDGVTIDYDAAGLRRGAGSHDTASAHCRRVAQALVAITLDAALLGDVPEAVGFHAGVTGARDGQARGVRAEADRRADLALRAAVTATSGEQLTTGTTALARTGAPGSRSPED